MMSGSGGGGMGAVPGRRRNKTHTLQCKRQWQVEAAALVATTAKLCRMVATVVAKLGRMVAMLSRMVAIATRQTTTLTKQ